MAPRTARPALFPTPPHAAGLTPTTSHREPRPGLLHTNCTHAWTHAGAGVSENLTCPETLLTLALGRSSLWPPLAAGVGRAAAEPRAHLGAQLGDSRGPPTEHRTPLKEGPGLTQQDCPNRWGRKVLFSLLPPLPTLWGPWGVPREITISEGHYRGDSAGLNTGRAVGRSELTDSIWKRPVGLGPWAPRWVLAGRPPRFGSWRGSDEHAGDKATGRRWELASALGPHKP